MPHQIMLWSIFGIIVVAMLAFDLGVFQRREHIVKLKEAFIRSGAWVALALLFNVGVYFLRGPESAMNFLAGYLLEESLSVDNLFVFLLIFSYFQVPEGQKHHVLFWGILGAVIMRAIFIVGGIALIHQFHFVIYFFGVFLIFTGIKLSLSKDKEIRPEDNFILKIFHRFVPVTKEYVGGKFFVMKDARLWATPLFIVLLAIETTDVVFALDSIPAVLGITTDPFIVYTSNVFAILGLRSIYFALAGLMKLFHYLSYGLSVILVFIGVKMLIADWFNIQVGAALSFIATVLILSVLASMIWPKKECL